MTTSDEKRRLRDALASEAGEYVTVRRDDLAWALRSEPIQRPGEGTDPLMIIDTKTGKVTVIECERCGKVDWRAVADYALGMAQGLALGCRVTSAEVQDEYDAAVARNAKGATDA